MVPAAVALAALGYGLFTAQPGARAGGPAPQFSLEDLRRPGTSVALGSLRGRPVVLNFWASWCDPCRDEAAELGRVSDAHGDAVAFVGINILDGRDEALRYLDQFKIGYTNLRDPSGRVPKLFGVTGVPESVFITRDGRIAGKFVGAFTGGGLDGLVRDLISLPPGRVLRITGRGDTRDIP